MERRLARFLGAGVVLMGVNAACIDDHNNVPIEATSIPVATSKLPDALPTSINLETPWQRLTATVKLQKIQVGDVPPIENFNETQEIIKAAAEYFCERTGNQFNAEELATKVMVGTSDEVISGLEQDLGRKLNESEKSRARKNIEETAGNGRIFINIDALWTYIGERIMIDQEVLQQFGRKDPETVILKTSLFHAFAHLTKSTEEIRFTPFTTHFSGLRDPLTVVGMRGFDIIALRTDGREFVIRGEEAKAEHIAATLARETGAYYFVNNRYREGERLFTEINRISGITFNQFLLYATDRESIKTYLQQLGIVKDPKNPDLQAAIRVITAIGLSIDGINMDPKSFLR